MSIIIFFGGLALGFLLGWLFMAILTVASMDKEEDQVYGEDLISNGLNQLHPQGRP